MRQALRISHSLQSPSWCHHWLSGGAEVCDSSNLGDPTHLPIQNTAQKKENGTAIAWWLVGWWQHMFVKFGLALQQVSKHSQMCSKNSYADVRGGNRGRRRRKLWRVQEKGRKLCRNRFGLRSTEKPCLNVKQVLETACVSISMVI